MANKIETSSKNIKPRINLNHRYMVFLASSSSKHKARLFWVDVD